MSENKEAVDAVAQAIANVRLFSRINVGNRDSVDGYPVEICRYGNEGEDEIVVVARFDASFTESAARSHVLHEHRARAALAAARPHILEEAARIAIGNKPPDVPPKQDTPYGQGREDAAAAIRAAKETGE